ncbi:MAG TPA: hypothetical protein PK014_10085 [Thermoanaerobaculia bacterium]|nr:hypothetical protein [Thermoanaerobaculia bacterium]HUM30467.1 hypothetical protein [Thermoanaerobaculia bacterium]HXK68666.1 hypothetical protein [Thermoanaerobaculia bacterium]
MRNRTLIWALSLIVLLGLVGCTDQEKTDTDVYLLTTVTNDGMHYYVDIATDLPTLISIDITSYPKNPDASLSNLQDVTLTRMVVNWKRADGGTVTPDPFSISIYHVVEAGQTTSIDNIPLMYPDQPSLPPFDQLFPWNGGLDPETLKPYVDCDAEITFYGRTANGKDITAKHTLSFVHFFYGGTK